MELSYSKIQEIINQIAPSKYTRLRVSVLRNITLEPSEPYLKYFAYRSGFNADIRFGGYDSIAREALAGDGELLGADTDCVSVFMNLNVLSWGLAMNYNGLQPDEIRSEMERIKKYIQDVLRGIRRQTSAMILWHGFETPVYPSMGIMDCNSPESQTEVVRRLNASLRESLLKTGNAYFVDMDKCLARLGINNFYDRRYWHIGRAPYTREAMREVACEDFRYIRALKGKNKKCLVLDCDNILWGGLVGEDGVTGIKLGKTYPGSEYYEFQQEIINLFNRGIIIALCSKNNENDVWEVFDRHPDMLLKREHIASDRINWLDKAVNIESIARELNIGLDSIVFVDDSDFETNLIRQSLSEVDVLHFQKDQSVKYRDMLASCGLFDTLTLSEEDKKRGGMYKAEALRNSLKEKSAGIEEYWKSTEMVIEIKRADEFSAPRVAQLTQKTNQFNLTTRRYSDAEIKMFAAGTTSDVFYLRLNDRFGDYGITGACILRYEDGVAFLDTFLLSCRVLGRGVEDIFLANILNLAAQKGCSEATGEYIPTSKNAQVNGFYEKHGFFKVKGTIDSPGFLFSRPLQKKDSLPIGYFKAVEVEAPEGASEGMFQ